ncbi:MAG: hypothetical protein IKX57_03675 [Oscillospiraceae bacterium]|nr:hypothetical protein [Oscillospiraceae bacterium]
MRNRTPAAVTANKIIQAVLFVILCCSALTIPVYADAQPAADTAYGMTAE